MANILLGCAIAFTFVALAFVTFGFATDFWIKVTVNREALRKQFTGDVVKTLALETKPIYFTRHRGLFKECYEGNETKFLDNNDDVIGGNCMYIQGLSFDSDSSTISYGDDYEYRNHMMRGTLALIALGMLLLLGGTLASSMGCWYMGPSLLRNAGIAVFLGGFFTAAGIAVFHGYDYLEREKINQEPFPKSWKQITELNDYSRQVYGYSYIVCWVGMGLSVIGGMLLLCSAYQIDAGNEDRANSEHQLERKVNKRRNKEWVMPQPVVEVPVPYSVKDGYYPEPSMYGGGYGQQSMYGGEGMYPYGGQSMYGY